MNPLVKKLEKVEAEVDEIRELVFQKSEEWFRKYANCKEELCAKLSAFEEKVETLKGAHNALAHANAIKNDEKQSLIIAFSSLEGALKGTLRAISSRKDGVLAQTETVLSKVLDLLIGTGTKALALQLEDLRKK